MRCYTNLHCCSQSFLKCFLLLGAELHNGQWHSVSLSAKRNRVSLVVDNESTSSSHASIPIQIFSGDTYYFGGKMHFVVAVVSGQRLLTWI